MSLQGKSLHTPRHFLFISTRRCWAWDLPVNRRNEQPLLHFMYCRDGRMNWQPTDRRWWCRLLDADHQRGSNKTGPTTTKNTWFLVLPFDSGLVFCSYTAPTTMTLRRLTDCWVEMHWDPLFNPTSSSSSVSRGCDDDRLSLLFATRQLRPIILQQRRGGDAENLAEVEEVVTRGQEE